MSSFLHSTLFSLCVCVLQQMIFGLFTLFLWISASVDFGRDFCLEQQERQRRSKKRDGIKYAVERIQLNKKRDSHCKRGSNKKKQVIIAPGFLPFQIVLSKIRKLCLLYDETINASVLHCLHFSFANLPFSLSRSGSISLHMHVHNN